MSAAPAAGGNGGGASREPSHLSYVTGFGICFFGESVADWLGRCERCRRRKVRLNTALSEEKYSCWD